MDLMRVEFGTKAYGKIIFDLDEYGTKVETGADLDEKNRAYDLLRETMNDRTFIDNGYRNNDAVNSCIALHVLGYDPCEWFDDFFDDVNNSSKFYGYDIEMFMDHVHRICGYGREYDKNYLLSWGPKGSEGNALGYAID